MKNKVLAFTSMGILAITLMAFVNAKKDDEKKKKYQVIHHENGELQEFDTIIPMNSNYSVDDFLKDKGISSDNIEIIKMPNIDENLFSFHGDDGEEVIIKMLSAEMEGDDHTGMHIRVKEEGEEEENVMIEHDGKSIKIIVEEGPDGEEHMKKYINGEEVEFDEGDVEHINLRSEDGHIIIKMDGDDIEKEVADAMKELEIELDGLDLDLDSIFKNLDINIEQIVSEEGGRENERVIIKMDTDMNELHEAMEELEKTFDEEHMKEFHKNITVSSDDEDFTIVMVTENIENEGAVRTSVKKDVKTSEVKLKLYPNPNNGTFTIGFEQTEKVPTTIEVFNASGKNVFKEKLGKFSGTYKKELDLKKHGSGNYIVKITRGDDVTTHKVVIE